MTGGSYARRHCPLCFWVSNEPSPEQKVLDHMVRQHPSLLAYQAILAAVRLAEGDGATLDVYRDKDVPKEA